MDLSIGGLLDKLGRDSPSIRDSAMRELCDRILLPDSVDDCIASISQTSLWAHLVLKWINDRYDSSAPQLLNDVLQICVMCVRRSGKLRDHVIEAGGVDFFKEFSAVTSKTLSSVCDLILSLLRPMSLEQSIFDLAVRIKFSTGSTSIETLWNLSCEIRFGFFSLPLILVEAICCQIACKTSFPISDCVPFGVALLELLPAVSDSFTWSPILSACIESIDFRPDFFPFAKKILSMSAIHLHADGWQSLAQVVDRYFPREAYVFEGHAFRDGTSAVVGRVHSWSRMQFEVAQLVIRELAHAPAVPDSILSHIVDWAPEFVHPAVAPWRNLQEVLNRLKTGEKNFAISEYFDLFYIWEKEPNFFDSVDFLFANPDMKSLVFMLSRSCELTRKFVPWLLQKKPHPLLVTHCLAFAQCDDVHWLVSSLAPHSGLPALAKKLLALKTDFTEKFKIGSSKIILSWPEISSIVHIACNPRIDRTVRVSAIEQGCLLLVNAATDTTVCSPDIYEISEGVLDCLKEEFFHDADFFHNLAQLAWLLLAYGDHSPERGAFFEVHLDDDPACHEGCLLVLSKLVSDKLLSRILSRLNGSAIEEVLPFEAPAAPSAKDVAMLQTEFAKPIVVQAPQCAPINVLLVNELWAMALSENADMLKAVWEAISCSHGPIWWKTELVAIYTYVSKGNLAANSGMISELITRHAEESQLVAALLRLALTLPAQPDGAWHQLLSQLLTRHHAYSLVAGLYLVSQGWGEVDPQTLLSLTTHPVLQVRILARAALPAKIPQNGECLSGEEFFYMVKNQCSMDLLLEGDSAWVARGNILVLLNVARARPELVCKIVIQKQVALCATSVPCFIELVHLCLRYDPQLSLHFRDTFARVMGTVEGVESAGVQLLELATFMGVCDAAALLAPVAVQATESLDEGICRAGWEFVKTFPSPNLEPLFDLRNFASGWKCRILSRFCSAVQIDHPPLAVIALMQSHKTAALPQIKSVAFGLFISQAHLIASAGRQGSAYCEWFGSVWLRASECLRVELMHGLLLVLTEQRCDLQRECWSGPLSHVLGLLTNEQRPDEATFTLGLRVATQAAPALIGKPVTGRIVAVLLRTERPLLKGVLNFCASLVGCPFAGEQILKNIDLWFGQDEVMVRLVASLVLAGGHCRLATAKHAGVQKWLHAQTSAAAQLIRELCD